MKIAVFGATGMIGSRIVAELERRGHEVTGYSRRGGQQTSAGTLADPALVEEAAASHDAVVSAVGPSRTGAPHQEFLDTFATVLAKLRDARLFVVGGAGSLLVDGIRLVDSPEFPEIYKAEALTHAAVLDALKNADPAVDWVYLSPAPVIAPGERTGAYVIGGDSPSGEKISAEDFAVAVADELERPIHVRERFTVAN